jgi:hypothetical protein
MAEKKAMAKDQGRRAQQKYIFFFYLWPHFARCYAKKALGAALRRLL